MNTGKTLFSQLMDSYQRTSSTAACVATDNHRVRRFSCRDQFLSMAFAQLTFRESLRDIETCLIEHKSITLDSVPSRSHWPGPTATGASTPIWPIG